MSDNLALESEHDAVGDGETLAGPFGISLVRLGTGSILLGSDKGALPYGSERPRHEVRLAERWIATEMLSRKIWALAVGEDEPTEPDSPVEGKSWEEIEDFLTEVSQAAAADAGNFQQGEWRLPSESEWMHAEVQLGISVPKAKEELLVDHPHANHRGAPTDGRPRMDTNPHSMMRLYRISRKAHPTKVDFSVKSQAPVKNGQDGMVFRLMFIPKEVSPTVVGDCLLVPEEIDAARLFKREAIIALVVGIIPSFAIPVLRGFNSYAVSGWANLLFGGLVISFASSVFWRPRTETWVFSADGQSMERRWLAGKDL
ncbi:MAG TPA: hypothetical protein EYN46_05445 [Candidatus Poseidoniales archaeon]|nr:hypothetical protein [Candidatus Poseidoniales archaeon]HIO94784.1 hypothetical protein [Candidatus Poseidoniales archaeon]